MLLLQGSACIAGLLALQLSSDVYSCIYKIAQNREYDHRLQIAENSYKSEILMYRAPSWILQIRGAIISRTFKTVSLSREPWRRQKSRF